MTQYRILQTLYGIFRGNVCKVFVGPVDNFLPLLPSFDINNIRINTQQTTYRTNLLLISPRRDTTQKGLQRAAVLLIGGPKRHPILLLRDDDS